MVLCQAQIIPRRRIVKTSCQISVGYAFEAFMPFLCAFSVDTQMPLSYTFSRQNRVPIKGPKMKTFILGNFSINWGSSLKMLRLRSMGMSFFAPCP